MRNTLKGNLVRFPSLEEDESLQSDVATSIQAQLHHLLHAFDGYFSASNLEANDRWIKKHFLFQLCDMPDEDHLKEENTERQHDEAGKMAFDVKILGSIF